MTNPTQSSCCGTPAQSQESRAESVRERVREGYGKIAKEGGCAPPSESGGCCGASPLAPDAIGTAVGYQRSDLDALPPEANLGLSCGNPTAFASLRPGEVVVDLGAGAGLDCFVAGPRVGASGRAIGVDMTAEMLAKARRNLANYRERTGLDNVEFRLGEIEHLPVADASVDVVISNCVINLSPEKDQVWREIARVLRPGGRVAVSDLALLRPLPESVRDDVQALIGCIAGASLVDDVRRMVAAAGLTGVELVSKPNYVDAMTSAEDPLYRKVLAALPDGAKPSDFVTSLEVRARKPACCVRESA